MTVQTHIYDNIKNFSRQFDYQDVKRLLISKYDLSINLVSHRK